MKFDSIPKSLKFVVIDSAIISFFIYDHDDKYGINSNPNNQAKSLYTLTENWSESSVTWNTQPTFQPTAAANNTNTQIGVWEHFNVTTTISNIVKNEADNFGFMLKFPNDQAGYKGCKIHSSEYTQITKRPKLTIYSSEDIGGDPFIQLVKPFGTVTWRQGYEYEIQWADNITENVKIEFIQNGAVKKTISTSSPSNGTAIKWTVPKTQTPGDYLIKVTSVNNASVSGESGVITISEVFTINNFPYLQTFDKFKNGEALSASWGQETNDDFNWTVHSGATPGHNANWPKSGPGKDHTTGSGKYLYTEATENSPNKKATLLSPTFDLRNLENPTLSFWYHMWSEDDYDGRMGFLHVDIELDGVWKNSVFKKTGYLKDEWLKATIDLSGNKGMVKIRFRGITGKTDAGDRAIDDFLITGTNTSTPKPIKQTIDKSYRFYQTGNRLNFILPKNPESLMFSISIIDMFGKAVFKTNTIKIESSAYTLSFIKDCIDLPSGVYICKFRSGNFCRNDRIILGR